MEENILIESKTDKKVIYIMIAIGVLLIVIAAILWAVDFNHARYFKGSDTVVSVVTDAGNYYDLPVKGGMHEVPFKAYLLIAGRAFQVSILLKAGIVVTAIGIISFIANIKTKLIVTDKRIEGKTTFGKNVNLPISQISSVTTGGFKSITFGVASGNIKFKYIKNNGDIQKKVSEMISG